MSSPVDEIAKPEPPTQSALQSREAEARPEAYGPDEERLVQMARQEAMLRLARAM